MDSEDDHVQSRQHYRVVYKPACMMHVCPLRNDKYSQFVIHFKFFASCMFCDSLYSCCGSVHVQCCVVGLATY